MLSRSLNQLGCMKSESTLFGIKHEVGQRYNVKPLYGVQQALCQAYWDKKYQNLVEKA